jgi:8-oxo-dGTP pyrophosphatase MutT (NUDIX family)
MGAVPPEYACAIIADARGRLLLQLRPTTARHAADQLTCFGGRREDGEDDRQCLRRELAEELGWVPGAIAPACELWQGTRFIARFFRTRWDGSLLRAEPGHVAVWAPPSALPGLPLSPWHGAVIAATAAGRPRVEV